jgi:hypothetical protein
VPHGLQYVRGFLQNQRDVSLDDADDKAIWHAIFTLRRKVQALRKKQRGGEAAGDVLGKILAAKQPRTVKGPF